jgi:flagellar hook-basal body complex protein FliE
MTSFPCIEPVSALPSLAPAAIRDVSAGSNTQASGAFSQWISQGLERVNNQLVDAQGDVQRVAGGDLSNLHQVMMKMEQSRLSFQLMLQVRNRLLEGYQEILRMQV